ncbi:hypothetical protein AX15_007760 [Amanita polypyramis BW_CC]|nr:hypothetical protein AX15_007760 [Amanita polypyramis BW_CC]
MSPVAYAGGLQQKKKSELQEIAVALKISDQGTRESLHTRIKDHLDEHQDTLEDNPKFAGLYSRKRRNIQPHLEKPSRFVSSAGESNFKPASTKVKDDLRASALESIEEPSPVTDVNQIKTPLSVSEITSTKLTKVSKVETEKTPRRPPPSSPKVPAEHAPKSLYHSAARLQAGQADILQSGTEMLVALRSFLSNSRNIWSLTVVIELLYLLGAVIPWKVAYISLIPGKHVLSFPVIYPPLIVFQTGAFWLVLLHWFIPSLLLPAIVGNLISFNPGVNSSPLSASQIIPFDPLTASIVRLAAQIAYPYMSVETHTGIFGLDILGFRWRVLNASTGLAFAFAEAIAGAPRAFAKTFLKEQRQLRKFVTNGEAQSPPSSARKPIAGDETLVESNK